MVVACRSTGQRDHHGPRVDGTQGVDTRAVRPPLRRSSAAKRDELRRAPTERLDPRLARSGRAVSAPQTAVPFAARAVARRREACHSGDFSLLSFCSKRRGFASGGSFEQCVR